MGNEVPILDSLEIPKHTAIIMDGNRRWAERRGLHPAVGHIEGVKALFRTVTAAGELGIEVLTVYSFSTENWKRTQEEVSALLKLIYTTLEEYTESMIEQGVRLCTIGDLSRFPKSVVSELEKACTATANGKTIDLVLALNYGGRDDIRRAAIRAAKETKGELTEEEFARFLDTSAWPDPELLIRTSGEMRLSNFLLWQASYSEIVVSETLWPDFGKAELFKAITQYQTRESRIGV